MSESRSSFDPVHSRSEALHDTSYVASVTGRGCGSFRDLLRDDRHRV